MGDHDLPSPFYWTLYVYTLQKVLCKVSPVEVKTKNMGLKHRKLKYAIYAFIFEHTSIFCDSKVMCFTLLDHHKVFAIMFNNLFLNTFYSLSGTFWNSHKTKHKLNFLDFLYLKMEERSCCRSFCFGIMCSSVNIWGVHNWQAQKLGLFHHRRCQTIKK